MKGPKLAVLEPAQDLGQVRFLAVHENAYTVDAAGDPEDSVDGGDHEDDREGNLPHGRHGQRDAQVHDQRCAEGDERDDAGERAAGIGDDGARANMQPASGMTRNMLSCWSSCSELTIAPSAAAMLE